MSKTEGPAFMDLVGRWMLNKHRVGSCKFVCVRRGKCRREYKPDI